MGSMVASKFGCLGEKLPEKVTSCVEERVFRAGTVLSKGSKDESPETEYSSMISKPWRQTTVERLPSTEHLFSSKCTLGILCTFFPQQERYRSPFPS